MLSAHPIMLQRPGHIQSSRKAALGFGTGVELALFRAREAMLDGWHFTPEELLAFTGSGKAGLNGDADCAGSCEREDEVDELPLYFSDP